MQTMHLTGSEDVRRAASQMTSAAETMQHAARAIDHSLGQHQRFLDDWLFRFQQVLEKTGATSAPGSPMD